MKTVIFAYVRNAGCSQMAAAFFNQLADLKGQPIEGVRAFRNELRDRVEALILREGAR